ncbi:hypothetical protein F3Y22_tig00111338pilonHSYRG00383 [Hibiscus syriacus]|uniref:Dienelactone hydrolase domain-containing protein n=1 Tax=Hibiscus syriacus TaxID=106335 RepID=A0A6A2YPC1_HIBSY|nr:hypothetical protein F3Y22_tig00111338pilonHSYRG00383 [Hibiscus syriacus]
MADSAFRKVQIQRDDTHLMHMWLAKKMHLELLFFMNGFKARIPDLYRGKVGLDVAEAQQLMEGLDWQVPEVDAVVAFYGVPSSELADPAKAKDPVRAHFGELDNFVGFSDVMSPDGIRRRKGMGLADEDEAAVQLAWSRFESWMARFFVECPEFLPML